MLIDETYQLGIEDKENNEVYLFESADILHVSHSVHVSNLTKEGLETLPPLLHDEDLSCTVSDALTQLSSSLESWLNEKKEHSEAIYVSRHLAAFDELVVLRKQVFTLLKLFIPKLNVKEGFDCTTADLDRYLLRIIKDLRGDSIPDHTGTPVVTLCEEPEYSVNELRQRVLTLLRLLLPKLKIPESFDLKRDLQDLINAIYSYNMSKF